VAAGKGHPLPESDEARHNELPETTEEAKGKGAEGREAIQPHPTGVNPDGKPYC